MIETTSLSRFQRILLRADGTVTAILETYAGEPVDAVKLVQQFEAADKPDGALEVAAGATVLRRRVLLRGRDSGQTLLYAEAVLVPDRLDPGFLEGLTTTTTPLGTLLADSRTETFREILLIDREPAGDCAGHFGVGPSSELIFRTYRIISRQRPIIRITEKFPAAFFQTLGA